MLKIDYDFQLLMMVAVGYSLKRTNYDPEVENFG